MKYDKVKDIGEVRVSSFDWSEKSYVWKDGRYFKWSR